MVQTKIRSEQLVNINTAFYVKKSATQTGIATSTSVLITWQTATLDDGGDFDLANNRYIAPATGVYSFQTTVSIQSMAINKYVESKLYVNGGHIANGTKVVGGGASYYNSSANITYPLNAGDLVTVYVYHTKGSNATCNSGVFTFFSGHRIS